MTHHVKKNLFCMFSAVGAGAEGMAAAQAEVAGMSGSFQCLGGIDIDAMANRVFERRLGVRAVTRDLMDLEQYTAFHDHEPPPGWIEATPDDIRAAARAIGTEILRTLMLADAGETFALSSTPIWVRPVVTALTMAQGGTA